MRAGVVVVAAGTGQRLGARVPKALVEVAGRPMLAHALAGLAAAGLPAAVVVHTPGQRTAFARAAAEIPVAALVPGGETRTASVRAGVEALPREVELVVVHDAARPLTPPAVIQATVSAVRGDVVAAAPGLPVADTLKRVDAGGRVVATVDRAGLVGVQTPQAFPRPVLAAALAQDGDATDDLALVERLLELGELEGRVVVVPGSPWARKVTDRADLVLVEALACVPPPGGGP